MFGDDGVKNIDSSYTSRVAEIFNVILKSLGIGLEFIDEEETVQVLNDDYMVEHHLDGQTYFCTDYQFFLIERINDIRKEILDENPVLTESALQEMIEKELKSRHYINGPLNEDLGDLDIRVSEEIKQIVEEKAKQELESKEEEKQAETSTEDSSDDEE